MGEKRARGSVAVVIPCFNDGATLVDAPAYADGLLYAGTETGWHASTQAESSSCAMAGVMLSKVSMVIASSPGAGRTAGLGGPCR
jgi:hypothetical protein